MTLLGTCIFRRVLMERNCSYGIGTKSRLRTPSAPNHYKLQITNYKLPLYTHADFNFPLRILQNLSMW